MHKAAMDYVRRYATPMRMSVIEIGSRNINGTVRVLFPNAQWTGLDLYPGPDVDVVCDSRTFVAPTKVDLVVCCEVLEHSDVWAGILENASEWLKPEGRIIVTCGGPGRPQHSHHDGGRLRPGEYYGNLTPLQICQVLQGCGMWIESAEVVGDDTRVSAITAF